MTALVILEGHGRPNVILAGQVGQKYKDLDSGLEYVCTGERGFIKVDGDDQSEMYNWELVESGGSTGGGVFTVNFTQNENGSASADKTYAEITEAFNNNMVVIGYSDGLILHHMTFRKGYAHEFVLLQIQPEKAMIGVFAVMNDNSITVMFQSVALTQIS